MLKQLTRVLVQFSPWSREGRSAREFLSRLQAAKAQASNPDCKIESRIRVKGDTNFCSYESRQQWMVA